MDLVVYNALDYFANSDGMTWASISTIAKKGKISASTVKRALPRLEHMGYIVRERRYRPDSKELDTTLYKLLFRSRGTSITGAKVKSERTEAGSERTWADSHGSDRLVPTAQEVGSERARNETNINETYMEREKGEILSAGNSPPPFLVPVSDSKRARCGDNDEKSHTAKVSRLFESL
jgi:DNA-binding transcriptional MocR family regulator